MGLPEPDSFHYHLRALGLDQNHRSCNLLENLVEYFSQRYLCEQNRATRGIPDIVKLEKQNNIANY